MAGTRRGRGTHIVECVPSSCRDAKSGEISEISTVLCATAKDVHDVADKRGRVALTRGRYEANTVLGRPGIRSRIVSPDIVKPMDAVGAAESKTVSRLTD